MAVKSHLVPAAGVLLLVLAVACSPDVKEQAQLEAPAEVAAATPPERPDRTPLIEGPVSPDGLKAILGTADLGVGPNRVGFVLTSPEGFVTEPTATVSSKYYGSAGSEGEPRETGVATYQPWPYGNRGLHTLWLEFDQAGAWGIDIAVEGPGGAVRMAQLFLTYWTPLRRRLWGRPRSVA